MTKAWILVCDATRARVFEAGNGAGRSSWTELTTYEHPEARAHAGNISAGATDREPHDGPKEAIAGAFAKSLAHELDLAHQRHRFDRLVLAAPPHFLGIVRAALVDRVARATVAAVDKDLTQLDARDIETRLRACLRVRQAPARGVAF